MYDKMYLYEAIPKSGSLNVDYVEKTIDKTGDNFDILLSLLNTLAVLVDETGDNAPQSAQDETISVINMDLQTDNNIEDLLNQKQPIHSTILQLDKEKLIEIVTSFSNHQGMTTLLTNVYGDQSQMCKILRFVDQGFVVSMLGHFGETLIGRNLRCKDVRGTWYIRINKEETTYTVIHRRKDQVIKPIGHTQLLDLFQFEWQLEIVLDSHRMHHIDCIRVKIIQIDWSTLSPKLILSDEERQNLEKEFRDSFGPTEEISRTNLQVHKGELAMKRQSQRAKQAIQISSPNDVNKGCFSSLMNSEDINDVFQFLTCKK
jgi:hypothetical protein